jgi:hypothetical protein
MNNIKSLHSQIDALYPQPLEHEESIEAVGNLVQLFELLIQEDMKNKKMTTSGEIKEAS